MAFNLGAVHSQVTDTPPSPAWTLYRLADQPGATELRLKGDDLEGAILRPDSNYEVFSAYPFDGLILRYTIRTGRAGTDAYEVTGQSWEPEGDDDDDYVFPVLDGSDDSDGDLLGDDTEYIIGTNLNLADSDADGIPDNTEIEQGTDPLDGIPASTGIIASAPTGGSSIDVCAAGNLIITANGNSGITIYEVGSQPNPIRIRDLDTPGSALAVACSNERLLVADSLAGLVVIDISNPSEARIVHQINAAQGAVTCVATAGSMGLYGTNTGRLIAIDTITGRETGRLNLSPASLQDVLVHRDCIYALQPGKLTLVPVMQPLAASLETNVSSSAGLRLRRWRLFAGDGLLYASTTKGFSTFDISGAPAAIGVEKVFETGQFGWKQIVSGGSGLALAATSPNSTNDGPHHVDLYSLGEDRSSPQFAGTFPTPGIAAAITINRGYAYVADSTQGLQVINYLPPDTAGVAPSITLSANVPLDGGTAEEGGYLRLSATVDDDVQVRNVEFHLDGEAVVNDGSFPFEAIVTAPRITDARTSFQVSARAVDTGGNEAWSASYELELVPDATPPVAVQFYPANGSLVGDIDTVAVRFSEAVDMDPDSSEGISVSYSGADGIFDTGDDVLLDTGLAFDLETLTCHISLSAERVEGSYRISVGPPLADLAGNLVTQTALSAFRIFSFEDTDGDGVPDDWEIELDLNPNNPDSDGDGIPDGLEDFDGDGLPNVGEIVLNRDPRIRSSNGSGVDDGDLDLDFDGFSDGDEFRRGTDPNNPDSDGDGLDDATEVAEGTDPNSPTELPEGLASLGVSFFNTALPFDPEPTEDIIDGAGSLPVAYFNTAIPFDPKPTDDIIDGASSLPVSFFNTSLLFDTITLDLEEAHSLPVTYENLEP